MKEYKIINCYCFASRPNPFKEVEDYLNAGWTIERADTTRECVIYVLSKDK